jgi:DNA-binding MarR family transcriptional regulator
VLVSLTAAGRELRENGLNIDLVQACGLTPEEFPQMRNAVKTLRDNLIKSTADKG